MSVNNTFYRAAPNTTYHYRIVAANSAGQTAYGTDVSFTTLALAPTVTTQAATSITATSAQMNGTINPNGMKTSVYFQYGTTTGYGSSSAPGDFGSGHSAVSGSTTLNRAAPNTTYHYRIVAANSAGQTAYGTDVSFTTLAAVP
ncbi:MAG: hypothetical protein ACREFX_11745 [Opitutaceae bacterium]